MSTKPNKTTIPNPSVDWTAAPPWAHFWAIDAKHGPRWGAWGEDIDITTVSDAAKGEKRSMNTAAPRSEAAPDFGWPKEHQRIVPRP
jgi:hypothetical protein